jgi:diguanylate cyclase (GGDEF)-like protein/PAS domain S-box-containing protein
VPEAGHIEEGNGRREARHEEGGGARARRSADEGRFWFHGRLFDAVGQGVIATDPAGRVTYWNRAAERMYGWSAGEALGRPLKEVLIPEGLRRRYEEAASLSGEGENWTGKLEVMRRDGTTLPVVVTNVPLYGEQGGFVGAIWVSTDLNGSKGAEEALWNSEECHRRQSRDLALLHGVRTALARELDPATVCRTVVEATAEAYGYTQVSAYLLEGDELVLQHQIGYHHVIERIPISEGVSGRVVRTRKPVLLEHVRTDPDFLGAIEGITSEICVPLFDEDEVAGVLNVESTGSIALTPEDLALMVAVSEHVGAALNLARLHARVRESERRYATLLSNAPALVYRCLNEPDWPLQFASSYALELTGHAPEELCGGGGVQYGDLIVEEDRGAVWEEVQAALRERRRFRLRYAIRCRDGEVRHVEEYGRGIYREDGTVEAIEGLISDVTDRRTMEEHIREAEERYRTLVERIPAVTFIDRADGSGEPVYVSPQVEAMLGYTPEEWTAGRLWRERLHSDDRERILLSDERFEAHGEPVDEEYRLYAKDGSEVWVREETVLVRGEEGEPLFVQGIMTDTTERREAEAAVRRSEASLTESQRIAHLGTWEWDVGTDEVWWSEETFRIYGFRPGEVKPALGRLLGVVHPDDRERLQQAIQDALAGSRPYDLEHRIVRPDGAVRWVHRRAEVVRGAGGQALRMIGTVHDITERKVLEKRLQHQALHDDLTGLPNRHLFVDRLAQALRRTSRRGGPVAVLFTDLDEFKMVNDSFGHESGDRLLVDVAARLRGCLRPEDTLARFGGDEFVILIEEPGETEGAVRVAERVIAEFRRPFSVRGRDLHVGPSIGISLGEAPSKSPEDLLRDADTAMYQAKEAGTGYGVFDPAMYERVVGRLNLENDLRRALKADEFVVHYQPLVSLETGGTWGLEALVRWEHPERGMVLPDDFVRVAEEGGMVVPLGERVLLEACKQAARWQERLPISPPLRISVNLSARQLRGADLEEVIARALRESGLQASALCLDLTETVYIRALEEDAAALDRLKATGVGFSIDDFGTGYSSLAYLKRLPAEVLKLDQSFVKGLDLEAEDTAIAQTIVDLAHIMGMEVIAEGVEIEAQAFMLREMGCDYAQGFFFSEPLPPEGVEGFLFG